MLRVGLRRDLIRRGQISDRVRPRVAYRGGWPRGRQSARVDVVRPDTRLICPQCAQTWNLGANLGPIRVWLDGTFAGFARDRNEAPEDSLDLSSSPSRGRTVEDGRDTRRQWDPQCILYPVGKIVLQSVLGDSLPPVVDARRVAKCRDLFSRGSHVR